MQKRKTENPNNPLTPIEKLLADKTAIAAKCRLQEVKLNEHFDYIRVNSSGLILSGLTSILFSSGGRAKNKPEYQAVALVDKNQPSQNNAILTLDNLFIVAKSLAPVVWSIVQPMLVRWGINKLKRLLFGSSVKRNRAAAAK